MVATDIMTEEVITVRPETSVRNLAKLLSEKEKRVSGAVVVRRQRCVLGIVSEAGIMGKKTTASASTPVEEIATRMTGY